ncbi:hypothetical protein PFISCL1PPCAC_118, partial [Pristionchus fissidentatus]
REFKFDIMERLIYGISADRIFLVLTNSVDSVRLLDFITNIGVEKISISIGKLNISNPEDFLLELAEICTEIDIWQHTDESIPSDSDYFFGIPNGDWGRVFPEMFKRKMDSLCIFNDDYSSFLPESTCEELTKILSEISDKELRFTTSYLPVEIVAGESNRTVNDYNISKTIDIDEYGGSNTFSITHKKREQFNGN